MVEAVRRLAATHREDLERLKTIASTPERRDLWQALLRSFGTLGRSRGWEELRRPENLARLSYEALVRLAPDDREAIAERVFRDAKVRLPARKAKWITANVDVVREAGGIASVQRTFESLRSTDEIVSFLRGFHGIGQKYARNIPMDAYHPAFRGTIAVDARIKSISKALGLRFVRYADEEAFYVRLALSAGLEAWELDRLLYGFTDEALRALVPGSPTRVSPETPRATALARSGSRGCGDA